ncbi:hypothetical protein HIM_09970 [Hirsutella minnesotensis 3608]|uniref:Integrase catalytic domain-containing protein n=1 Tax=Hirsutella minnesotensis 3608 TaxID=1043627 RepID=A0A0F7ZKM3_9HYPO|nr:hypothetical protein HIM_09970 [Hirsutella minnesotensis 3608]
MAGEIAPEQRSSPAAESSNSTVGSSAQHQSTVSPPLSCATPALVRLLQPKKRRLRTPDTWKHFRLPQGDEETHQNSQRLWYCQHCQNPSWRTVSTTSAKRHMRKDHGIIIEDSERPAKRALQQSLEVAFTRAEEKTREQESRGDQSVLRNTIQLDAFYEAQIQLITRRRLPLNCVSWPEYQALLCAVNPLAEEILIHSGTTVLTHIERSYEIHRQNVKAYLQASRSQIHFSIDLWSSPHRKAFLGICAQWVDERYEPREALLGLPNIQYSHSGETMSRLLLDTIPLDVREQPLSHETHIYVATCSMALQQDPQASQAAIPTVNSFEETLFVRLDHCQREQPVDSTVRPSFEPEPERGPEFVPFHVPEREPQVRQLPPTPLLLFQLFVPTFLVETWVKYTNASPQPGPEGPKKENSREYSWRETSLGECGTEVTGPQGPSILRLYNAAFCENFACNLVSYRKLKKQGIWFDDHPDRPTSLRGPDHAILALITEKCGQLVLEDIPDDFSRGSFFTRRNKFNSYTKRRPQKATAELWHLRLGHPGPRALEHLVNASQGVRIKGIPTHKCDNCAMAKIKRQIRRTPRETDSFNPGERLAVDFHDFERDGEGYNSLLLVSDRNTGFCWDYYLTDRTTETVIATLAKCFAYIELHHGFKPRIIECDNELISQKPGVEDYLRGRSFKIEPSAPYTQDQNGGAERSGGVIKDKARAMRGKLPTDLWVEITKAATYLNNRTPKYRIRWKTPYERLYGHKPAQEHLRAYGCKVFAMTSCNLRRLARNRGSRRRGVHRVVALVHDTPFFNFDDDTDEASNTQTASQEEEAPKYVEARFELLPTPPPTPPAALLAASIQTSQLPGGALRRSQRNDVASQLPGGDEADHLIRSQRNDAGPGGQEATASSDSQGTTSSRLCSQEATAFSDSKETQSSFSTLFPTPKSLLYRPQEAARERLASILKDPKQRIHRSSLPPAPSRHHQLNDHLLGDQFKEAEEDHLKSHRDMGSWREVKTSDAPKRLKILDCMWVYIYKFDKHGFFKKCKARLVVRGDQQARTSSQDTYAATLAGRSFRTLMAISARFDLELIQYDAVNAFVNANLDEEVYMKMPPGHRRQGTLLRLVKALYGLRKSPLLWHRELTATLRRIGFKSVPHEPCCLTLKGIIVFFYVDDIVFAYHRKDGAKARDLETQLQTHYKLTGGKDLQWFLGIEILRDREQQLIWLSQSSYIDKIGKLASSRPPSTTPMSAIELLPYEGTARDAEIHIYQVKVGSLLYAAVITRPDIGFAVSRLARFNTNPGPVHHRAADRVLLYLQSTRALALQLGGGDDFEVASDASFADNSMDRKSSQAGN